MSNNPLMFYESETGNREILTLYYPVPDRLFKFIVGHQYKSFSPRFFTCAHFCPSLDKEYMLRVIGEGNNWPSNVEYVHVTRFLMKRSTLKMYARGDLSNPLTRIVCPRQDLSKLNKEIIGLIECVATKKVGFME